MASTPPPWAVLISLLLAASSWRHACAQTNYSLLAGERPNLVFTPYTLEQKQQVWQQASNVFAIWVNHRFKLNYYDDDRVDPFPRLSALQSQLENMTTADLHLTLASIFNNVRDLNTNYVMTGPYTCYSTTIGTSFTFADSDKDFATNPKVVVKALSSKSQVQALIGDKLGLVSIGDELLTIDGLSFMDFVSANVYDSAGANTFGGMRSVFTYIISNRQGIYNQLPEKDSIDLTFRSASTLQVYNLTIPYVAVRDEKCWGIQSALYKNITGTLPGGTSRSAARAKRLMDYAPAQPRTKACLKVPLESRDRDLFHVDQEPVQAAALNEATLYVNSVPMYGTEVSSVFWGIYQPNGKNLGVLRFTDLAPRDSNGREAVSLSVAVIRGLLVGELKDTNALVIDLRGNGAGYTSLVLQLQQLFKPDFVAPGAKYLHNSFAKRIFVDSSTPGDSTHDAYINAQPYAHYTALENIYTFQDNNYNGQAFLKPVGLLTDGMCYSTCDVFSSSFANSAAGPVFGEDGQTGGGASLALGLAQLSWLDPGNFQLLPFSQTLGDYRGSMLVSMRAFIQNGLRDGLPVEDYGVRSDIIVRPTVADLLPNATSSSQFDRIADSLRSYGRAAGKNGLYFILEPETITVRTRGFFPLTAEVANLTNLFVYNSTGSLLRKVVFPRSSGKQNITVSVKPPSNSLGNLAISVQSFASAVNQTKQLLKTLRTIIAVPPFRTYFSLNKKAFLWDLNLKPYVGVYNKGAMLSMPQLGWVQRNRTWVVGDGIQYANNVDTSLQFFFQADVGSNITVSLNATYNTEPEYDFFYVNYLDDNGIISLLDSTISDGTVLPGISGNGNLTTSFAIQTKAKYFSIALQFVSDPGVQSSGVSLFSFSVM